MPTENLPPTDHKLGRRSRDAQRAQPRKHFDRIFDVDDAASPRRGRCLAHRLIETINLKNAAAPA